MKATWKWYGCRQVGAKNGRLVEMVGVGRSDGVWGDEAWQFGAVWVE